MQCRSRPQNTAPLDHMRQMISTWTTGMMRMPSSRLHLDMHRSLMGRLQCRSSPNPNPKAFIKTLHLSSVQCALFLHSAGRGASQEAEAQAAQRRSGSPLQGAGKTPSPLSLKRLLPIAPPVRCPANSTSSTPSTTRGHLGILRAEVP